MALYNKIIENVKEEEENPGSHADKVKSLLIGGVKNVGAFYDAGDRAAGIYEPAEAISDKISEIPVVGGAGSFAWDVLRPDFMDVGAFKAGPAAGAGQYVTSLPAGIARATGKRLKNNPKLIENSIDAVLNAPRRISEWGKRKVEDAQYLFGGGVGTGTGVGGPLASQTNLPLEFSDKIQSMSYKQKVISKMAQFGMGDGVFRLRNFNLTKGVKKGNKLERSMLEAYLSPEFIKGRYSGFDKANRAEFAAKWENFIEAKGLDKVKDLQIHHINPLYDSIHLFDGVKFDSDEYWDVIEAILDSNASLGVIHRGEAVNNLIFTLGKSEYVNTPHGIAHKYLNEITPTFFSKDELLKMRQDPTYRIEKAKDWAKIVNKQESILLEAHKQWSLLNPEIANQIPFDELIDTLSRYTDEGYSKWLDPKYQLPDFHNIILEIANDKKLKGPIFRLQPPPIDKSRTTLREQMEREADIINEQRIVDQVNFDARNPKPDPNPGQMKLDLGIK